jgi:hypothetical protein
MKTTIPMILASALLAGSVAQAASAHEQHRHARVFREAPVAAGQSWRNSYATYRPYAAPNYSYDDWQARDEAAMSSGIAGH